jgi:hypothetical protein
MTRAKIGDGDTFLRELAAVTSAAESGAKPGVASGDSRASEDSLSALARALPQPDQEAKPSADARARLLAGAAALRPEDRFERFTQAVSELLDVGFEQARATLARIDDADAWVPQMPGVSFLWVDGGARVQDAVRGFVRVEAGATFPEHEHFGDEIVLVMQGSFVDSVTAEVVRPAALARRSAGTSHAFRVPADGPHLLKLAVVQKGLRVGEAVYGPR